jgi:hypothetical protein
MSASAATQSVVSADAQSDRRTRLHGRTRTQARITWLVLIVLDLMMVGAAIPATYNSTLQQGLTTDSVGLAQLGISAELYAALSTGLALTATLLSLIMSLFLFCNRSDDWIVLLVSFVFVVVAPGSWFMWGTLGTTQPLWLAPVALQFSVGLIATELLIFTFPSGRFVPGRTRVALVLFAVSILVNAYVSIVQGSLSDPALEAVVCYGLGFVAQLYRYRRNTNIIERQQFRWIVFGFFVYAPTFALFSLLNLFVIPMRPEVQRIHFALWGTLFLFYIPALLLVMTAIIATLRYRLWDIDVIINRTLVYLPLTALLAGLFAASIA